MDVLVCGNRDCLVAVEGADHTAHRWCDRCQLSAWPRYLFPRGLERGMPIAPAQLGVGWPRARAAHAPG